MTDLEVRGDALHAAARTVRAVVADLQAAGTDAHEAAEHVGHDGLAHRVRDFADQWDIHRGRTVALLTGLADSLDAVNDTFADLDGRAASAVRGASAA